MRAVGGSRLRLENGGYGEEREKEGSKGEGLRIKESCAGMGDGRGKRHRMEE